MTNNNTVVKMPSASLPPDDEPPINEVPIATLQPLTMRKASDILAMEFSDDANIIGDFLVAEEQDTTIVGPAGSGKSRLVLQMYADTVRGKDFLNFKTCGAGKRWVIFNSENSNRRLKADFERLRNYCGNEWPTVDENLSVHTLESEDDGCLSLENPANAIRIEQVVRDLNPCVTVFDPLSEYGIRDLNRDEDMRASCKALARVAKAGNPKRANIVLHHTIVGRAGAAKAVGFDRGSYGRNSKALLGWARAQINLAPGSADSNDSLVVSCGKCSNGREFEPFAIRLNLATMIYEVDTGFDLNAWLVEFGGQKQSEPLVTIDDVRELCQGGKSRADLAKLVQGEGVSRQYAYKIIKKADRAKRIHFTKATDRYVPTT